MTLITAITSDVGRSIEMRADRLAAQDYRTGNSLILRFLAQVHMTGVV